MTRHEVNLNTEFFDAVNHGIKTCEVRSEAERTYRVGDTIVLREVYPERRGCNGFFSGRKVSVVITHKIDGGQFGIAEGYCVLSIRREAQHD